MNIFLLIALYALQNSESAVLKQGSDYRDKWFNGEKNRLASFPTAEKESDPAVGDDHNNLVKDKHRNNWGDNIFQHYGYGEKNEATVEKNRAAFAPLIPLISLFGILLYEFRLASSLTAEKGIHMLPAIGDDRNNLVFNYYGKKKSNAQRTSRQKRNLLTDLIQPHMDEMWDNHKTEEEAKEDREAYEWMLSVGWEKTIKPVLEKMIEDLRAERERETDPEKIYIQDRALEVWNDVLEGGEPFIRWLLIEDQKLLRQKIESKDSQKQAQEQEHQVMKIGSGSLYSMCLEECKKFLGTHEHCHSPCSKFANSFGRRQKTDETDEDLKAALERLLEEYLREEEGQS